MRIASHRGGEGYKAREGEVREQHDGQRAQKRPLPGTRPGLPPEPEPQVRGATVGHVAAPEPLLSPMLADTAAEAVDAITVHFLLKDALKHLQEGKKKEEEEERRWLAQVKAMTELSRQLPRKRKRKKRKLPRAPLPRCGRPCAVQRQVPAVLRVLRASGSVHRQSAGFPCCATETWYPQCYCTEDRLVPSGIVLGQSRCARVVRRQLFRSLVQKARGVSTGAVLGQGDIPVVILSDAFGLTSQKTVDSPQLQSIAGRRHFLSCRKRRSSWSRLFSRPQSFLSCCTFQVVDAPVVLVVLAMPRARLVMLVTMRLGCVPLDLRHYGRYGPDGQLQ